MSNGRIDPLRWLGIALVVAVGLMAGLGYVTMSTTGGYYGMMGGGSWGWALVMMGIPAVILVLILLAALGGLGEPAAVPAYAPPAQNPVEILEQRYARGELSREDYLKIREDLTRAPSHS